MHTIIRDLGQQDYSTCYTAMRGFTAERKAQQENELWLVEHRPVFTQGLAGKPEHLLSVGDIPVIQTDRGGQVTYHGPGQLIVYLLIDLNELKIGAKEYVQHLEQAIINFLMALNISGKRKQGAPGVYVNDEKIAALGVRIKRGFSYHGIAINVNNDLSAFLRINPCGYANQKVTSLNALNINVSIKQAKQIIIETILNEFQLEQGQLVNDVNRFKQWAA